MHRRFVGLFLAGTLFGAALVVSGCATERPAASSVEVVAEGGAWSWFSDPRAIVVDSSLYVGYVDSVGHVRVAVQTLGGRRDTSVRLSSFQEVDDHDNPALLSLDGGGVLATYAQHHEEPHWYWRVERPPAGGAQWTQESRSANVGAPVTYANLVQLSSEGRIYNFFRGMNFDPAVMTSDDGGTTWSAPTHVLKSGGGGTRPYVKYVSDGQSRIDLLYTQAHPRQERTNVYHLYYEDGTVHRSDGTAVCRVEAPGCLPVPAEKGTLVYDADTDGRGWVWDVEYGEGGAPVAAFVVARDSTIGKDLRYHYARYDTESDSWQEREIAYAGTRLYEGENHYAGGIALDPTDVGRAYISADVDPETGEATDTGRYQIFRGSREPDGSWSWTQLTTTEREDNLRPFVPDVAERRVVLWLQGEYRSYTDYETDVVGRFQ